ncbi:hypothetical protein [Sphingobacterium sp. GVS05A]|uniref:hypothetical protein n=1 Tax=Sphingobacterium TaxID=28453 RepID=UPI001CBCE205|nr:hypothetical protein [Sphingobacterium sp. GVS05A]
MENNIENNTVSLTVIGNLTFRALSSKRYQIAIGLILIAILIPVAAFMGFVMHNNITDLNRGQIIGIMGGLGILSFACVAFIFSKFLAKKYIMAFYSDRIVVQGDGVRQFDLDKIASFDIWNDSDYAKLVISYQEKLVKYHVGFANLIYGKPILENRDKLDAIFTKERGFDKMVENRKGITRIYYSIAKF